MRNESTVVQNKTFCFCRRRFPDELTCFCFNAPCETVVGTKVDPPVRPCRCESHGSVSRECPMFFSVCSVEAIQRVVGGGTEPDAIVDADHMEHLVVTSHRREISMKGVRVPFGRAMPCRLRRRGRLPHPTQRKVFRWQFFVRCSGSPIIVLPHRPVSACVAASCDPQQ